MNLDRPSQGAVPHKTISPGLLFNSMGAALGNLSRNLESTVNYKEALKTAIRCVSSTEPNGFLGSKSNPIYSTSLFSKNSKTTYEMCNCWAWPPIQPYIWSLNFKKKFHIPDSPVEKKKKHVHPSASGSVTLFISLRPGEICKIIKECVV